MDKKLLRIFIMFLLLFTFTFVKAKEFTPCEKTDEYKEWLKLSEEEKAKVEMPPLCKSNGINDPNWSKNYSKSGAKATDRATSYPTYYLSKSTAVKDQDRTGICWAMASTSVLESYLLRKTGYTYTYSPGHLNYMESQSFTDLSINKLGYNRNVREDGGNYWISSIYYMNHYGPVYESTVPTVTNTEYLPDVHSSTVIGLPNVATVKNIQLEYRSQAGACTTNEKDLIKSLITNYGPTGASIYFDQTAITNNSYIYTVLGGSNTNHSVTIVGWDDNYSSSNFTSSYGKPSANGAWIIQNSYGTSWGNNGKFYISYEDTRICTKIFGIRDVDWSTEDNKYISNQMFSTFNEDGSAAMSVFNKKTTSDELLGRVTFEVAGPTSYKVYYYPGNAGSKNINVNNMTLIGSGSTDYTGWVTVDPNRTIVIPSSTNQYSIAVVYGSQQIPVVDSISSIEDFKQGTSYLWNGSSWRDMYSLYTDANVKTSISSFTDNLFLNITNAKVNYTYNDYFTVDVNVKATGNGTINAVKLVKGSTTIAESTNLNQYVTKGNTYSFTLRKSGLSGFTNGQYTVQVHQANGVYFSYNIDINVIRIDNITITNPKGLTVPVGGTLQLNAALEPANHNSTDPTITWKDYGDPYASVDSNGLVTGKKPGNAIIYAVASNGHTAYYVVKVIIPITKVVLDTTSVNMNVGGTYQVNASVEPTDTTEDKTITWSSSNNNIATVDQNGLITAKASGYATIKATSQNGVTSTVTVGVNGISLNKTNATLKIYDSVKLVPTVITADPSVSKTVTWWSSNTKVATVDSTGKVTAKGQGTASIVAKDVLGRKVYATIKVNKISASLFKITGLSTRTYNAKLHKPTVSIWYNGKKLRLNTDYTIKYTNNKNPGKANVIITANPKSAIYTGSKTFNFVIKPKKAVMRKPTTKAKTITAKINSQPNVMTYQIQYRIKGTSQWKTLNLKASKKATYYTYKISGLVKGKYYQIRARGYITINKTNYFGDWSLIKTIKCK